MLVCELTTTFTPVHIRVVQSSQFHESRQKHGESVDDYAQELRRLFRKAYPKAQQGSREAEEMGQSVLTYQFAAGLLAELKPRVAGTEGTFEQLLTKAWFEKAELRDLQVTRPNSNRERPRPPEMSPRPP